jgi:RHS repeat-associated protein
MMRQTIRLCFFAFIYSVLAGTPAQSQNSQSYLNDLGSTPYGVNIPVENGFINISNGNLHLEFALATHPQRGALSISEKIVYDSRIWMFSPFGSNGSYHWWPYNIPGSNSSNNSGGWRFVQGNETGTISYLSVSSSSTPCGSDPNMPYNGPSGAASSGTGSISWTEPNGTVHPFNATFSYYEDDCNYVPYTQSISPGSASDGSGFSMKDDGSGNPLVIDNNGTQVYPQIIDRYGNFWSTDGQGNLMDTTGRVPVIKTQNGNVTYYDVLAPNGPINNNGTRVRYTVTSASVPVATNFQQSYVYDWISPGILNPVQSILLPDGSQYTFTYDSYGELASVTLPTGGVVQYGYSNFVDSSNTANRWLSSRTQGSNPPLTITPSVVTTCPNYSTGCVESVNLHKPSGDETVYQLTLINGAWNTGVTTYTGSAASGQTLSKTTSADTYTNGCSNASTCFGANYLSQSLSTTVLYANGSPSVSTQTQALYNAAVGKPSAVKEWDYGTNFSGTPTRETDYAYTGVDVQQVTVLRNGNTAGQTTYGYISSATTTSGVAQHGTQNAGGPYLQTISHWLNTGNPSTTTYTMDDTGQVRSVVDPNQNPSTNFSYQCANSLPYQTTNSLNQTTTYGYDCNSGAITSAKDPNDSAAGRSGTTYAYESVAGRLQTVNSPDGGQTSYSYPSTTEVDTAVAAAPDPTITSADIADSYGRSYQHVQAGASTETTYDANGRTSCVTNPHFTSSSSVTDGSNCVIAYDGLDRPLQQREPDSSMLTSSYGGNVTTSADETGYAWQRTSDVFGHLVNVVEPTGASTGYVYDGLGNLKTITQNGVSGETPRIRGFVYDSLSRLTSSTNPETGTIGYGYDSNGNVTSKTDARGITTSYVYDALNRPTTKIAGGHYNSYVYDVSDGTYGKNGIGRLVNSSNDVNAATVYGYDPMGRVSYEGIWTPSSPNNSSIAVKATYDLAGNINSLTYPDGRTVNQTWDGGRHLTQVADSSGYAYLTTKSFYWPNGATSVMWYGNGVANGYYLNNRLQIQEMGKTRVGSTAPGNYTGNSSLFTKVICYGPATAPLASTLPGCTSFNIGNNGNIWQIRDALNDGFTQTYGYDSVNRLTSFVQSYAIMQQNYAYDSFGNLNQNSGTLQDNVMYSSNNQISNNGYVYDQAGNVTSYSTGVPPSPTFGYDAESKLVNVNNGAATYTYDGNGDRARKDVGQNWTEYVHFNGQVLAEKNSDSTWSDYIYANGQRIARADNYDIRIHMSGTNCSGCGSTNFFAGTTSLTAANGHVIRNGDLLTWRQYSDGSALGGIHVFLTNNGSCTTNNATNDATPDSDGQPMASDGTHNSWHLRVVDLSQYQCLKIGGIFPWDNTTSSPGNWDIYFGDIVLVSTDGTSIPVYSRAMTSLPSFQGAGVSNLSVVTEKSVEFSPITNTTYYSGDQIGSTRMTTTYSGWPISSDIYYPFGQEPTPPADNNHYKFTGQERDSEASLDYFNARHYSFSAGRFMSPDPYNGSMDPSNPQSFNRYGYVLNNPLRYTDPSGLDFCDWFFDCFGLQHEGDKGSKTPPPPLPRPPSPGDVFTMYVYVRSAQDNDPNNAPTVSHCLGVAAADKGVSIGLDILGAIPAVGNAVSAGAGIVRAGIAVNHAITSPVFAVGSGVYGAYGGVTGGPENPTDSLVGSASAGAGIGLALADVSLAGTKAIPIVGNFVSVATLGWDGYQAYKKYQSCLAGH